MALGVALVAVLLIQRTTSGRKGAPRRPRGRGGRHEADWCALRAGATLSAAAFLGWGGWLLRWGKDYLRSLWTSYSR